jgi:hypothetical protein
MFAGFAPRALHAVPKPESALDLHIKAFARAVADVVRMAEGGLPVLPHQEAALSRAERRLETVDLEAAHDLSSAFRRDPKLGRRALEPGGMGTLKAAMSHEAKVRLSPELRADRFVADWRRLAGQQASDRHGARLHGMVRQLDRDPQLAQALAGRRIELGLGRAPPRGAGLAQELARWIGRGRGPELGR